MKWIATLVAMIGTVPASAQTLDMMTPAPVIIMIPVPMHVEEYHAKSWYLARPDALAVRLRWCADNPASRSDCPNAYAAREARARQIDIANMRRHGL